jgi:hypothetical protein
VSAAHIRAKVVPLSDPMHLSYSMHRILAEKLASAMLGEPVSVDQSQGYSQYYTWSDVY